MKYYEKEINIIKKSNRFRRRILYDKHIIDMASNDYLGLARKKQQLKKAYKLVKSNFYTAPKSSIIVNGYSTIHKKFEKLLLNLNKFEDAIVVGSGFLANISLIESMVRKKDVLFIDEQYHASGILASKLVSGQVIVFQHNDYKDLENKILQYKSIYNTNRILIAIEGIYSMSGDIAPKQFDDISKQYDAILIVDEAHSSGIIGQNLLGWFDYYQIKPQSNHIKMGTLGKAYGSYGAYILATSHIISFLENRAKPIIYSTAPSLFDIALAYKNLQYMVKHKIKISNKIHIYQKIVKDILGIEIKGLILPIEINDNKKVIDIQQKFLKNDILIGAIRQPTVKKAILRIIIKLDIKTKKLSSILKYLNIETVK